jgi:predicted DNA-binding transcriptional regulator AlpA
VPTPSTHHLDRRATALIAEGTGNLDDLLTTEQVAQWLQCSTQWLEIGRHEGYGPPWRRLGPRMIRYHRGDVIEWLRSRAHSSIAEYRTAPRRRRRDAEVTG